MTSAEREAAHADIVAAFERHGLVDYVYAGVALDGSDVTGLRSGHGGMGNGNRSRTNDLFGLVQTIRAEYDLEVVESWGKQRKDRER